MLYSSQYAIRIYEFEKKQLWIKLVYALNLDVGSRKASSNISEKVLLNIAYRLINVYPTSRIGPEFISETTAK